MINFNTRAPPLPPGVPRYPHGDHHQGESRVPAKIGGLGGILYLALIILGIANICMVGYSFSYHKGTYRQNLFHSELAFLVVFSAAFIDSVVNVAAGIVSPQPFATNTIQEEVSAGTNGLLTAVSATVLLIQLSVYGEYFVNDFGLKVFAGILGLIEALLYFILSFVMHRSAQALM